MNRTLGFDHIPLFNIIGTVPFAKELMCIKQKNVRYEQLEKRNVKCSPSLTKKLQKKILENRPLTPVFDTRIRYLI